jgi:hypothetical protein
VAKVNWRVARRYNPGVATPRRAGRAARRKAPQPPRERRQAPRVRPSRSARILDVSTTGIAIETAAALAKGALCELILQLDERRMPVTARVLRRQRSADAVRASLVFERMLESDRRELERSLVREVAERMTVIVR